MEKYSNAKKYPNYDKLNTDIKDTGGESYYRGFTYSEFASIFRYNVLEGGQKAQKMQPFLDEFNSQEYYKFLKDLIRLGIDKIDLDRLAEDVKEIKISSVKRLKKKLDKEYVKKLDDLRKLGYEDEEGD